MNRKDFFKELLCEGFNLIKDHPIIKSIENFTEIKERPPGASKDDKKFQQSCTGCDACMAACPIDIIMIEDLENRYPIIYPEKSPCIHCEGYPCITACPTGALHLNEMASSKGSKERHE
jgi:ferredoxin-type protein NapG